MTGDGPCLILDWDSAFFSVRIARLRGHRLPAAEAPGVLDWCRAQGVRCLYFQCSPEDDESTRQAERHGFHLVDVRVEFVWRPGEGGAGAGGATDEAVRPYGPRDRDEIVRIAADSYRQTRFYFDGGFPQEKCSALYRLWAEKSCDGWADAVLVAPLGRGIGGFITCHLDSGDRGRIGLVGVKAEARGRGVGGLLLRASQAYFARKGAKEVVVATQARNVEAQRLYQKGGFVTAAVYYWYHRWFDDGG